MDLYNMNISIEGIKKGLPKTKQFVPVHLFGRAAI
jgi:dTDP-4-amino-4,6-dideoxygalactose transaminase